MEKIIVLIGSGKSDGLAYYHKVRLFDNKEEAESYCFKVTDIASKYYTVAEIIEEDKFYESDREGFE